MARQFGHTWWGRAWVDALETRAHLDPNRLPRGRTYARQDRVSTLHVGAGEVTAFVRGGRPGRYRVLVRVRTHDDEEWDRLVATIAGRAAHAAALLDGDLDPEVADDARSAGVDLLPGPGDLLPRCSCPDWADPCKHAAAVCYLVADVLDDDPFALFTLRGRSRDALMAQLREHRRAGAETGADGDERRGVPSDEGQVARDAWRAAGAVPGAGAARRHARPSSGSAATGPGASAATAAPAVTDAGPEADAPVAVPGAATGAGAAAAGPRDEERDRRSAPAGRGRLAVPARPGAPAPWPSDPPADAPFTARGLRGLATDAARRAWAHLRGGGGAGLDLDAEADLARRAAAAAGRGGELAALAAATGATTPDLERLAAAWAHGGDPGVAVLTADPWRPPVATMAAARTAVVDSLPASARVRAADNRITVGGLQLRLDRAGRWWRFEKSHGRWEVTAPPAEHPDDLLDLT